MALRTVEITKPSEIHIQNGQLTIEQKAGTASIPIEDIAQITAIGPNIRLSTMDLSILTEHKVAIMTLDQKYLPTALVLPFEGNARQSRLIHQQVELSKDKYSEIWYQVIPRKISNQARALSILGFDGAEAVAHYANTLSMENVDAHEALAAKEYFTKYHEGLNRRNSDPVNSRLNYGYAIVRSAIARAIVTVGCHPAFGIHHNSQLNSFNLADDLIEPYRPMVDLVAHENVGAQEFLSRAERKALAAVLHNACMVNGTKMSLLSAITATAESFKRILGGDSAEELVLPTILPIEEMEVISE